MGSKDDLIDFYGYRSEIWTRAYEMMGKLLDRDFVAREVKKREMTDIYIYGGGYLGIQLYRAITPFVNVLSIVDRSGKLKVDVEDIPLIDMDIFRERYKNELVVITPIQYYGAISNELQSFISNDKILFLEEFGRE